MTRSQAFACVVALVTWAFLFGSPEVTPTPRLVPAGDLKPGEYFCHEVSNDLWYTTWCGGDPEDYPKSSYYGVQQPAPRYDAVWAVNLTTGRCFLLEKTTKVRRASARVIARVGE